MKKLFRSFLILLLCLCLLPSFGMLLSGPSAAGANEILSAAPKLRNSDGSPNFEYLSDAADYFNDHFAFRQQMITLWSAFCVKLFGTSPVSGVTAGSDGWLYFTDTLSDYTGAEVSEEEIAAMAKNLSLMQEYLAEQGIDFVFAAAPNKNTLYPEHMPPRYANDHESSALSRLQPLLTRSGVNTADLVSAFSGAEETLYYRTDSHWNGKGAALAADTILAALDRRSSLYTEDFEAAQPHTGDLYRMLYPAGTFTEPDLAPTAEFTYTTLRSPNGGEAISIDAACETGEGSLYCWRDSFGVSLYPYLAQSFASSFFTRTADYDLTKAAERGSDTVILELVERNLKNLIRQELIFPAPERALPEGASELPAEVETGEVRETAAGKLCSVKGSFPQAPDPNSSVYIFSGGVYYEACIVFDENGRQGFSAWLPVTEDGTVTVFVG